MKSDADDVDLNECVFLHKLLSAKLIMCFGHTLRVLVIHSQASGSGAESACLLFVLGKCTCYKIVLPDVYFAMPCVFRHATVYDKKRVHVIIKYASLV